MTMHAIRNTFFSASLATLAACASGTPISEVAGDAGDDTFAGRDVIDRSDIGGLDAPDENQTETSDLPQEDTADVDSSDADDGDTVVENQTPVAVVDDRILTSLGAVTVLDGSDSYDPDEDGAIVQFAWDLPDGRIVGAVREQVFDSVGEFDASLTVTDNLGATATKSFVIEVGPSVAVPEAVIEVSPNPALVGVDVDLDGSASNSDSGEIVDWAWTIESPDGAVVAELTGEVATYSFETTGPHQVLLQVEDSTGERAGVSAEVYVGRRPQAVITVLTAPATVGVPIGLSGSDSTDEDDVIVAWRWRLPDGATPTGPTANFTSGAAGTVAVSLEVEDEHGFVGTAITEITIVPSTLPNTPPVCDAGADRTLAPGEASMFSATCTDADGTVSAWEWDFGDGSTAATASAFHSFEDAGSFTVRLTATDDDGASTTDTLTVQVVAPMRPPIPRFTVAPDPIAPGAPADFDARSSSDPDGDALVEYRWDWGDGSAAEFGSTATHVYASAGVYNVQLRVLDATGLSATVARSITVDCAPGCLAGTFRMRPLDSELPAEGACLDGSTSITVTAVTCDIGFVGTSMEMTCGPDRFAGTITGRNFTLSYISPVLYDDWCEDYTVAQTITARFVSESRWEGTTDLAYNFFAPWCFGCEFPPYLTTGTRL
jgi:PKD repeat protein